MAKQEECMSKEECIGCKLGLKTVEGMHYYGNGIYAGTCHTEFKPEPLVSPETLTVTKDPYASLAAVLERAMNQASSGKGKERHAKSTTSPSGLVKEEPFEEQKILEITRRVGSGYPLGQAIKKAIESKRLGTEAAVAELLGAINYLAAEVIHREED